MLPVVRCNHGSLLKVYRAPRFRAGQHLSVARASGLCLHRSPEFFAVPKGTPGRDRIEGRVCQSKIYGCPERRARPGVPLAEEAKNSGERSWTQRLTGNGRRAASTQSAIGAQALAQRAGIGGGQRPGATPRDRDRKCACIETGGQHGDNTKRLIGPAGPVTNPPRAMRHPAGQVPHPEAQAQACKRSAGRRLGRMCGPAEPMRRPEHGCETPQDKCRTPSVSAGAGMAGWLNRRPEPGARQCNRPAFLNRQKTPFDTLGRCLCFLDLHCWD